jgi:hypothetical protein
MAVDKSYGSGKPRSAANSAARRDKAESASLRKKNVQKVASKPFQKQALASVGKQAAAGFNIGGRQYLETGVSGNKLAAVSRALFSGGKTKEAINVGMRAFAKRGGQAVGRSKAGDSSHVIKVLGREVPPGGNIPMLKSIRSQTTKGAFPRLPSKGGR